MTEDSVRNRVSYLLILGHFGVLLLVLGLWAFHGFLFSEMTTTVALIVPMFATYTTTIIQSITKNKNAGAQLSNQVSSGFVFLSFFLPVVFLSVLILIIILKAFNVAFESFEQFKLTLAICESAFGVYVGKMVTALFRSENRK